MSKGNSNSNRIILSIILIGLLVAILFYFQGASQTEDLSEKEPVPQFNTDTGDHGGNPSRLGDLPSDVFPKNGSLPNLPTIPDDVLPEVGGGGQDWGLSEIEFSNQNPNLPTPTNPDFPFPSEFPSGINTLPSFSQGPGFSRPSVPPISINPGGNGSDPKNANFSFFSFNFSKMPARSRYMPQLNLSSIFQIDLKIGGFNIELRITLRQVLFFVAIVFLYISSGFLIEKLSRLDEKQFITQRKKELDVRQETTEVNKQAAEELKRRRERVKRLKTFRDHLLAISEWVKSNIDSLDPSLLVVTTYHRLDDAFAKFSNLRREPGDTPLEHALQHFEQGEINNEVLERLVHLFYYARYGKKELTVSDADLLVYLLENLVSETYDEIIEEVEVDG